MRLLLRRKGPQHHRLLEELAHRERRSHNLGLLQRLSERNGFSLRSALRQSTPEGQVQQLGGCLFQVLQIDSHLFLRAPRHGPGMRGLLRWGCQRSPHR